MAGLIDTSAIIILERRGDLLAANILEMVPGDLYISSVTASELLVGLNRAPQGKKRDNRERAIAQVFESFPCLPFDFETARVHAEVQAEMMANGQRIGAHDLIIAATALAHGYFVLTHNLRDFQRVPGLSVKTVDW